MQCSVPECKNTACCEKTYRFEAMLKIDADKFLRQPCGFLYYFCEVHKDTHEPYQFLELASNFPVEHTYHCSFEGCTEKVVLLQADNAAIIHKCLKHIVPPLVPMGIKQKPELAIYTLEKKGNICGHKDCFALATSRHYKEESCSGEDFKVLRAIELCEKHFQDSQK